MPLSMENRSKLDEAKMQPGYEDPTSAALKEVGARMEKGMKDGCAALAGGLLASAKLNSGRLEENEDYRVISQVLALKKSKHRITHVIYCLGLERRGHIGFYYARRRLFGIRPSSCIAKLAHLRRHFGNRRERVLQGPETPQRNKSIQR